jgi:hypothetical protein
MRTTLKTTTPRFGPGKNFRRLSTCLLGGMLVGAGGAWGAEKVIHEADKTVHRQNTVVDFSDVNVEGELVRPEGAYVIDRQKTSFPSRIKVRSSFAPELQRSVDNL